MPNQVKWYGDDFLKQLREATPDALFDGAEMLVKAAAAKAPEMTGKLKESGYAAIPGKSTYKAHKQHNKEIKVKEGQAIAAFSMFYAGFVEFGTKKKAARPFMRRALDEVKSQLGETISAKIGRKLK